jgi:hypothetical protein
VIALDRDRLPSQSAEHLAILDRIETGDQAGAAALLVLHLDAGRASKARLLKDVRLQVSGLLAAAAGTADAPAEEVGRPAGSSRARAIRKRVRRGSAVDDADSQ